MSSFDKIDNAEKAFQDGDKQALKDTVIDVQDNKQFMKMLSDQMNLTDHKLNLPGLEIVDNDHDGSPESIHANKLTLSKEGDSLKVTRDGTFNQLMDNISDFISSSSNAAEKAVDSALPQNRKPGDASGNQNEQKQLEENRSH